MRIRIEGHDLPGRDRGPGGDLPGHHGIHVGVQRRDRPDQWLDLQPGDAATVSWELDCTHAAATADGLDVRGPWIQGGSGPAVRLPVLG